MFGSIKLSEDPVLLNRNEDSSNRKIDGKRIWNPKLSTVEKLPNDIVLGRGRGAIMESPHWHAQIEVNYIHEGYVQYELNQKRFELTTGGVAVFWGGQPHRICDRAPGTRLEAIHLPLLQFFRLRLPDDMRARLMQGAVLKTLTPEEEDAHTFARWCAYFRSGQDMRIRQATEELLLRIERIALAPYAVIDTGDKSDHPVDAPDQKSFEKIQRICEFVTQHFREEIDAAAIANSANLHPKYAMSVFKKSTGVTLSQYVQLLRLSYAQSLLLREGDNVLQVAMDSGFGSLSQFNKAFRKHAGVSPSEFKRQTSGRFVV